MKKNNNFGPCGNDARYPNKHAKRGSVTNLEWFAIPTEPDICVSPSLFDSIFLNVIID